MNALTAADFRAFYVAIHGRAPFPWQERLVAYLAENGTWPEALVLPTASGKTSALDVAVFHLAMSATNGQARRAPVRIAFVVDRRLIVDSTYEHGLKLRAALLSPSIEILERVAAALATLSGDPADPLFVSRLRGGAPREGDWTPSPSHPTIVCSTVDQIGSRLLFRGYGISPSMRPVHAGLLGDDALIFLDEVHLSEPFRQTLEWIRRYRKPEQGPWHVVQLSATPRETSATHFHLDDEDRANATLSRRLTASKRASLDLVKSERQEDLALRLAERAIELSPLATPEGAKSVLVVVNRVDLARMVHSKLSGLIERSASPVGANPPLLLIGRAREVEKDGIRREVVERTGAGRPHDGSGADTFFLVATQTVEAGADLDFEGLVTQAAPLDALRQRFGRLDRLGNKGRTHAFIVTAEQQVARKAEPDPIYGEAIRETWTWLNEIADAGAVDFGIDALDSLLRKHAVDFHSLSSPATDAPILLLTHLDILSRTRPAPNADVALPLFLHGSASAPSDVQLVFRADLPASITPANAEAVATLLDMMPPRSTEMLPMPYYTVRRWLQGSRAPMAVSDVEGTGSNEEIEDDDQTIVGWRWNAVDVEAEPVRPMDIRPGDLIVLPSAKGGCDEFGWNPQFRGPTRDVAGDAQIAYRERAFAIRFHPALLLQYVTDDARWRGEQLSDDQLRGRRDRIFARLEDQLALYEGAPVADLVGGLGSLSGLPSALTTELALAAGVLTDYRPIFSRAYRTDDDQDEGGILAFPRGIGRAIAGDLATLNSATEDDESGSLAVRALSLRQHSADVETLGRSFAERLGLDLNLSHDVGLAAWLHDQGKADERFQRYLAGSRWRASAEPLAKSSRARSPREDRRARDASGLPPRWRHEALSVAIATRHPRFSAAHDPELVLWLIGTHHGWGRPLFPHMDALDGTTRSVAGVTEIVEPLALEGIFGPQSTAFHLTVPIGDTIVDLDWPEIFERLTTRYGFWGLAKLESLVRLADHRASEIAARGQKVLA